MLKLIIISVFILLFSLQSNAQVTIGGKTAFYDSKTDTYLISTSEDHEIADSSDNINIEYTHLPIIKLSGDFGNDYTNGTLILSPPNPQTLHLQ